MKAELDMIGKRVQYISPLSEIFEHSNGAGPPLSAVERIPVRVFRHSSEANCVIAAEIAHLIRNRAAEKRNCVLGLATGSTPVGIYNELVRLHREEDLSFANVVTFNLDEYFPMQPHELQSYVRFMREHLFDLVDIQTGNWHVPDGPPFAKPGQPPMSQDPTDRAPVGESGGVACATPTHDG
jgi:hypothetical protein